MKRRRLTLYVLGMAGALASAALLAFALRGRPATLREWTPVKRAARISPDYADTVIPPNIAPLNFVVGEPGARYCVKISSAQGNPVSVFSNSPRIVIPLGPWKELLDANRGGKLCFDIDVESKDGRWTRFEPITNAIAREKIDGWLVYREMPVYNLIWSDMGIYQRNLGNYDVSVILRNRAFGGGCLNCHTFLHNRPDPMAMNVRSPESGKPPGGMVIAEGRSVLRVVDTKTKLDDASATYLAWHPSGKGIAFSLNKVLQCFHTIGYHRDVFDTFSDIAIYRMDSNMITTTPELCRPDRKETYPTWSPDGRYLYYCSAPQLPISRYKEVRYDLMRIRYDLENDTWGKPETVLSSADTGLSIAHPRISPDGKFLLCCMSEYGNFPAFSPSSDLYLLDLKTRQCERLAVNSDQSDAYHSWSSNSRWIVFSSKRLDGVFTRPFFSYVDETGRAHKPFLLPQEDPAFYESYIRIYNLPELITEPVRVAPRTLAGSLYEPRKAMKARLDPRVQPPVRPEPPAAEPPGPGQYVE